MLKKPVSIFTLPFLILYFLFLSAPLALAQSEPPPRLFILSPAPGEVILSDKVQVIVNLPKDLSLIDPAERQEHVDGEGHLHLWLDATLIHDDTVSVTLAEAPVHVYENVFSGLHTLYAEFYRNDHSPYEPLLAAKVEFETGGEELKPAPDAGEDSGVSVGDIYGGLFLPPGKGNTIFVIILVMIGSGVLWYFFGRRPRKK